MATTTPFEATDGFSGLLSWIASSTDGWFFIIFLAVLFLIAFIPMLSRWGMDSSLLATSFGVMLISIPIYYAGGLSEEAIFVFILIFVLAIVKSTVFKEN